jgi:hypothetical protein
MMRGDEEVAGHAAAARTITVVRAADGGWRVEVDGAAREVDARQVRPGTWSLLVDGQSYLVDLDPRKKGIAASVGLAEALITVEDAQTRRLRQSLSHGPPVRGEEARPSPARWSRSAAVGDEMPPARRWRCRGHEDGERDVAERGGTVAEIKKETGQSVRPASPDHPGLAVVSRRPKVRTSDLPPYSPRTSSATADPVATGGVGTTTAAARAGRRRAGRRTADHDDPAKRLATAGPLSSATRSRCPPIRCAARPQPRRCQDDVDQKRLDEVVERHADPAA